MHNWYMMKVRGKTVLVHDINAYTDSKFLTSSVVNFSSGRFTLRRIPGDHCGSTARMDGFGENNSSCLCRGAHNGPSSP
jgi:hypothetical protein